MNSNFWMVVWLLSIYLGAAFLLITLILALRHKKWRKPMAGFLVCLIFFVISPFISSAIDPSKRKEAPNISSQSTASLSPEEQVAEDLKGCISNTFLSKNDGVLVESEGDGYIAKIRFDAVDNRYADGRWCGSNGLNVLEQIKYYQPETDRSILRYELSFYADGAEAYQTVIDNTTYKENSDVVLTGASGEEVIVTQDDIAALTAENAQKKEQEKAEKEAEETAQRQDLYESSQKTLWEIHEAYENNELSADDQYKNNRYTIAGTFVGAKDDGLIQLLGDVQVTIKVKQENRTFFAVLGFDEEQRGELAKLNKDDQIIVEGECWSDASWTKCELQ